MVASQITMSSVPTGIVQVIALGEENVPEDMRAPWSSMREHIQESDHLL
jgi:hypothetical protein